MDNAVLVGVKFSEEHVELLHGWRALALSGQDLVQEVSRLDLVKDPRVVNVVFVPNIVDLLLDEVLFHAGQLPYLSRVFELVGVGSLGRGLRRSEVVAGHLVGDKLLILGLRLVDLVDGLLNGELALLARFGLLLGVCFIFVSSCATRALFGVFFQTGPLKSTLFSLESLFFDHGKVSRSLALLGA